MPTDPPWRTTEPVIVRREAGAAAPEVARLPIGAVLFLLDIHSTWARVRGRAGGHAYEGYVPAKAVTPSNC